MLRGVEMDGRVLMGLLCWILWLGLEVLAWNVVKLWCVEQEVMVP